MPPVGPHDVDVTCQLLGRSSVRPCPRPQTPLVRGVSLLNYVDVLAANDDGSVIINSNQTEVEVPMKTV